MSVCATYDPDCYGCRLRAKAIGLSSAAIPSRQNAIPPRKADPAWERGVAGTHRPDGTFVPFLTKDLNPMGVKEYGENRHKVDEQVRRLHQSEPVRS